MSSSNIHGAFYPNAAVSQFNYSKKEVFDSFNLFFTLEGSPLSKAKLYQVNSNSNSSRSIDLIHPALTRIHELDHYTLLNSTPFGLYIWRIYIVISTGISYVYRKTKDYIKDDFDFPINEYYYNILRKKLAHVYSKKELDNLENIINEVEILKLFRNLLLGKVEGYSMGDFIEIANVSNKILSVRSDFKYNIEWKTRLNGEQSYLPNNNFSNTEIIEASARLNELSKLKDLNFSKNEVDKWYEQSIFGAYKPVFEWLEFNFSNIYYSKIAIEQSFLSPIDLSCYNKDQEIVVEDVLPNWRLDKVLNSMQEFIWDSDIDKTNSLLRTSICLNANLEEPDILLRNILNNDIKGEYAWEGDLKRNPDILKNENVISLNDYYSFTESEFKRAFNFRLQEPLAFINPLNSIYFQPLIEFYKGEAHFSNHPNLSDEHLAIAQIQAYRKIFGDVLNFSLFEDGDLRILNDIQQSIVGELGKENLKGEHHSINNHEFIRKFRDKFIF